MIKQIKTHPNYAVSDKGNVYRITENGLVELRKDISNGYARVQLNGTNYYVATLVAESFLEPKLDERQKIFYIDGDRSNCNVENLMWLSKSEIQRYSTYTIEYRMKTLRGGV